MRVAALLVVLFLSATPDVIPYEFGHTFVDETAALPFSVLLDARGFRGVEGVKESSEFQSKLQKYPRIHNISMVRALNKDTVSESRLLVFRIGGGELGNRLLALASSFLLALLMDRALLIDWPAIDGFSADTFDGLFESPMGLQHSYRQVSSLLTSNLQSINAKSATLELTNAGPDDFDHILCRNMKKAYKDVPVLVVTSNQYFLPALLNNAHLQGRLRKWFGSEPGRSGTRSAFDLLLNAVVRPQPRILKEVDRLTTTYNLNGSGVCVHIRRQNRERDKDGATTPKAHIDAATSCAKQRVLESGWENATVFVASDHERSRRAAIKRLEQLEGIRAVAYRKKVKSDTKGMEAAMIDLWTLGQCKHVIVTGGSTYSYVAHARQSNVPWIVTLEEQPRCLREVTSEPCMHTWPFLVTRSCFKGGVQAAFRLWGQANCRPWDMEWFRG